MSPRTRADRLKRKEDALAALSEHYYDEQFDPVLHELQKLPAMFTDEMLDEVVEARASVLETVSEKLSKHVLANYDAFVRGVNEVASVEKDLQRAHEIAKTGRGQLALASAEVGANMKIAQRTQRKQGLLAMLEVLGKLQQASQLQAALKEAQDNCEYAAAFWLCAQCCKSLEALHELRVVADLNLTVNKLYEDTIHRLESALQAVCADFKPEAYTKVLEGYNYLGNVATLGEEVMHCFVAVVNSSALKVVRGVVASRTGLEDRARSSTILQEIVKCLPPDLFRTCLAKVLMVVFDILQAGASSNLAGSLPQLPNGRLLPPDASSSQAGAADDAEELTPAAALAALEEKEREEAVWGEALMRVAEGLVGGRRWLWDEAARKITVLLSSPAAFEGEHFLQVLEWTQQILRAGEAFSGTECTTLRDALARQSGKFFEAFHAANLQALHAMLDRELWARLPMIPGALPDLVGALEGRQGSDGAKLNENSFEAFVQRGNPWRAQKDLAEAADEAGAGSAPSAASDDEEAEEVYGDSIDEDNQRVKRAAASSGAASVSGRPAEEMPMMTNSSWRMLKLMSEYAELMRILRSEAGKVFSGLAELFELYLLHVFHVFSDVSVAELVNPQAMAQGGGDAVPVRLRNVLLRIVTKGLTKYRDTYVPTTSWPVKVQLPGASGTPGTPTGPLGQQKPDFSPFGRGSTPAASPTPDAATALSNPGNMYGLQERKVAVDSLLAVAAQLSSAHSALANKLVGRADVPEHRTLDAFFQTIKAASDVRDSVLRTGARLNLPIRWLPDRIAESNFHLEEPPSKPSPWVGVLLNHLKVFRQRLETAANLGRSDIDQLWGLSLQFVAEQMLEGIAKAGPKGKCTVMGRSAMSLDLQAVSKGLQMLGGPANGSSGPSVADTMRIVDSYIKAFYIPWGEELRRWAQTHPEYTRDQIMMLIVCIAESTGLKRKERNALLAEIESDLRDLRAPAR
ncbi:hypothetical protein WJX72_004829 [[Myrmecia] bisecta]|uniref:Uncharacterized protein n=1 Tax=[Myrmecia] bisecta TaxID=41462 RepID=A0AAW1QQE7_9CHLO